MMVGERQFVPCDQGRRVGGLCLLSLRKKKTQGWNTRFWMPLKIIVVGVLALDGAILAGAISVQTGLCLRWAFCDLVVRSVVAP